MKDKERDFLKLTELLNIHAIDIAQLHGQKFDTDNRRKWLDIAKKVETIILDIESA